MLHKFCSAIAFQKKVAIRGERDGALEAETTIERWRIVVVAVATIAALPLFVLENPNSFGSATSVAGATETSLAATTASVSAPVASENSELDDPAPIAENVSSSPADETQALLILAEAKAQRILENAVSARQQQELSVFETAEILSAERAEELVNARTEYIESQGSASPTTLPPYVPPAPDGPTEEQWYALRRCESTNNYQAISPSGTYRGAYQFSQATWDFISGISAHVEVHHLFGMDPIDAAPADQDLMALTLYNYWGRGQWPECGRFLP